MYLMLLTLSLLAGCQSTPSEQDHQLAEVTSMEKVKNYDGLINHYKSQLEQGSQDPVVKQKLAWAYFYKGDIESADFYAQHLVKNMPHFCYLIMQKFASKRYKSTLIKVT